MNIAEKIIAFNKKLDFKGNLPNDIRIMNPYKENPNALTTSSEFYTKYFSDNNSRKLILGINPGRFGAGITGIPFTDTYRLKDYCNMEIPGVTTRELSSVFVYDVIEAFGGSAKFYSKYLISSIVPLGFVKENDKGKEVNYNYYDSKALTTAVEPFIIETLEQQIGFGIDTSVCYCLGTGKNYKYLQHLNKKKKYFDEIIPLEHPRYVMQYKLKKKQDYIDKFIGLLA